MYNKSVKNVGGKKMSVGYAEQIFYLFTNVGNSQEVILRDNVDKTALDSAVAKAVQVHPWVKSVPCQKDGDIYFKETADEFKAIPFAGPMPLGDEKSSCRFFGVTYHQNKIWLNYHHSLCDGTGRMIFYNTLMHHYFGIKNKKEYDEPNVLLSSPEDLYGEPFAKISELTPGYQRPALDFGQDAFVFPEMEALGAIPLENRDNCRYHFTVKESDFMAYVKDKGMTPSVAVQIFMAKAIQELNPGNQKRILCGFPVNLKKMMGCPNSFKNGWVLQTQELKVDQLSKDESELGKEHRAAFKERVSEDALKAMANDIVEINQKAQKFKTMDERRKHYFESATFGALTYTLTYIGTLQKTEYSDELVDSIWSSLSPAPMISMVDFYGMFSITINSPFVFADYAAALVKQFEAHGIPVQSNEILAGKGLVPMNVKLGE